MAAKARASAAGLRRFDLSAELRDTADRRKRPAERDATPVASPWSHEGTEGIAKRLFVMFPSLGLDVVNAVVSDSFHTNPHCSRELLASNAMAKLLEISVVAGDPQSVTSFEPAHMVRHDSPEASAPSLGESSTDVVMQPEDGCLDEQLAALLGLDDSTLLTCVKTLLSALRRIEERPADARVKRLRRGNERFHSEVGRHEPAVALLHQAGFIEEDADKGDPAFVFHGEPSTSAAFLRVRDMLDGIVEAMGDAPVAATSQARPAATSPSVRPLSDDPRQRIAEITEQRLRDPRAFREAALARGAANRGSGSGLVIKTDLNISGSYSDDTWKKDVVVTQTGLALEVNYGGKVVQGRLAGNTVNVNGFRSVGTITSNGNIQFGDGGHWTLQARAKPLAVASRRAQHFTLADVDKKRVADEIANTTSYAEEYRQARQSAPVHDLISLGARQYDPELLGRKALDLTNRYRATKGLPPCRWHGGIARIAAEHAGQMASGAATFSHDGFDDRVRAFPVAHRSAAENLAYSKGHANVAETAVDGWIKSPGHEKNLRSASNLCGIGVAQASDGSFYLTQLFALAI